MLHHVINVCLAQMEPAPSIMNLNFKINAKLFAPKGNGQQLELFLARHAHRTITKIPSEAHLKIRASDAPVRLGPLLVPRQSTIASPKKSLLFAWLDLILRMGVRPVNLVRQALTKMISAVNPA